MFEDMFDDYSIEEVLQRQEVYAELELGETYYAIKEELENE